MAIEGLGMPAAKATPQRLDQRRHAEAAATWRYRVRYLPGRGPGHELGEFESFADARRAVEHHVRRTHPELADAASPNELTWSSDLVSAAITASSADLHYHISVRASRGLGHGTRVSDDHPGASPAQTQPL